MPRVFFRPLRTLFEFVSSTEKRDKKDGNIVTTDGNIVTTGGNIVTTIMNKYRLKLVRICQI